MMRAIIINLKPTAAHPGRYNLPKANEVAILLVDQVCDKNGYYTCRDNRLQRISEIRRFYYAQRYSLTFCRR